MLLTHPIDPSCRKVRYPKDTRAYSDVYGDLIAAQEVHFRTLLSSPNFYHANLADMENAQKLVNQIVRLDRLPPTNPLEGLQLLRDGLVNVVPTHDA